MESENASPRRGVELRLMLAGALLAWAQCAPALNPALDVSQYAHTAWKVRDGFFKGGITTVAQTPDGYLWLGTDFGLLRFDGVRAVPWRPPDSPLPANQILSLLAARDGTLWIGTWKGLASWRNGRLTAYPELSGQFIYALLEDRDGTVWVGAVSIPPPGRLCAIRKDRVQCSGEDGILGAGAFSLYEDAKGSLWVGTRDELWRWKPGPPTLHWRPGASGGIRVLGEDNRGALLVGTTDGIRRIADGRTAGYPLAGVAGRFWAHNALRDRDGSLWVGIGSRGLVHMHRGRTNVFAQSDGLSGNIVSALFQDREGNVWAATNGGLDRFRDLAVVTYSVDQGLSSDEVRSVVTGPDASVWFATLDGLNRWNDGHIVTYGQYGGKLNGHAPRSLFRDRHGRIWVSTDRDFGYLKGDEFVSVRGIPSDSIVRGIAEDASGNLWVADQDTGLDRLLHGAVVQRIPWVKLGRKDFANALAVDPLQGGLWVGFFRGGVSYVADGQPRASYGAAEGLGAGRISDIRFDRQGRLWVATESGLSWLHNGRAATLTSRNGLPCNTVHWVMEDRDAHSFWLYMSCGLVRIARDELDAWAADTKRVIQATVLDSSDGVGSRPNTGGFVPRVAASANEGLWFLQGIGVSVINPSHLSVNKLPPPVHIEQITADGRTYDPVSRGSGPIQLPPLVRDLTIAYTALSLVVPEKVRFRFKLEGQDQDWREVVNDRRVEYSNLRPGDYRFRVLASNNSGVWNEQGDALDFSIAPAYWQTNWFRPLCGVVLAALLWAAYQLRLRRLARGFEIRLDARVEERTRIARELHDTLLQSFHGLLLRFQAISNQLPPGQIKEKLDGAIEEAAEAITEGRDAVQGLRATAVESSDLAPALKTAADELAAHRSSSSAPALSVIVEGTPRTLHPVVRDEIYRIGCEALRNAFVHAGATRIEVELGYDEQQLRMRVRDDGKGIDPKFLAQEGRAGHFGLHGMRERSKLIGGKLTIWSGLNSGTEVELSVPAAKAYSTSPAPRRSWFAKMFSRKGTRTE